MPLEAHFLYIGHLKPCIVNYLQPHTCFYRHQNLEKVAVTQVTLTQILLR